MSNADKNDLVDQRRYLENARDKTLQLLDQNRSEWEPRYAEYATKIIRNLENLKQKRNQFHQREPLNTYVNFSSVMKAGNTINFDIFTLSSEKMRLSASILRLQCLKAEGRLVPDKPTVRIHRGSNQIGGSIIEVASATTRILLDAGTELDAPDDAPLPEIEGLFDWPGYDAVFFSHNHLDHIGLAREIHPDIPLYAGERALAVMRAMADYLGKPLGFLANAYHHNTSISVGDLTVTPFIIDRIVTMYRAAKRSGRVFIEDLFIAEIARAAAPSIPSFGFDDVRVFINRYYAEDHRRYQLFDTYGNQKIGRGEIAGQRFVMCVRASMGNLLGSLADILDDPPTAATNQRSH